MDARNELDAEPVPNLEVRTQRIYMPRRIEELVYIVRAAQRLGKRVRAVGSGGPMSDVIESTDYIIETQRLTGIVGLSQGSRFWGADRSGPAAADRSPVLPEALSNEVLRSDRRLVHVLAGTVVEEIEAALEAPAGGRAAWAVNTTEGVGGRSLAGAMSLGTRNADPRRLPITCIVRAVHLVSPDGDQQWVERNGAAAITDPSRLKEALPNVPASNIHYDDARFEAALVPSDTSGIIYAYVLEAGERVRSA